MPTPHELALLALLDSQRRQAASTQEAVAPVLPDLTLDMLLSASARREVEAAQMLSGQRMRPLPAQPRTAPDRPQARDFRASPEQVEMSLSEDMGDIDLDGSFQQVTSNDEDVLNSLFMGREAMEAQSVLEGGGGGYTASGYDIEFDTDSLIDGRSSPNEAARWQVGREDPPRMPFSGRTAASGPSDGVVVSSRNGNGSWQNRNEGPSARLPDMTFREPGSRSEALAALREANRDVTPRPLAKAVPAKSVYQHILDDGDD
jgi:hypothetical protein